MAFGNKEKKEQERQEQAQRAAEAQAKEAERLAQAKAQRENDIQEFITKFKMNVRNTVNSGTPVSLFRAEYIPVDAQMNEFGPASGLDLEAIGLLGSQGWTVISVVPRTYGGFESYKISKTTAYGVSGWGKDEHKVGLGGHIVGVYALLAYTVTQMNLDASGPQIEAAASESLPELLKQPLD